MGRIEGDVSGASEPLRPQQRHVGAHQHLVRAVRVDSDGSAQAQGDGVPVSGQLERVVQCLCHARRHVCQFGGGLHPLDDHDELVAAHPSEQVLRAEHGPQPVRDLAQEAVTGGVPEAVVDHLEAVEVAVQHPHPAARHVVQSAAQPLVRQEAVGGTGEGVMQGSICQLKLRLPTAGDVLKLHDDAICRRR